MLILFYTQLRPLRSTFVLNEPCLEELRWKRDGVMTFAGKSLEELSPDLIIYSDASSDGWGATMNAVRWQEDLGRWWNDQDVSTSWS